MKNNDKFELNKFLAPDSSCAPVYIWVWNDVCTREIIDEGLSEMLRLGIRAFYILPEPGEFRPDSMPTRLSPEYLSDEYFELCAYAIDKGTELGMNCWIYDEGGWPSGSACGRVVKDHPEYSVGGSYPDLLNKNATEYFIEITHKKYAKATGNFTAVFTDEPKAPLNPFNEELVGKYEKAYGESALPYRELIENKEKPTEENIHILHRWYDLCSRAFCENYLLPCKKWANENGFSFTGHLDKDHRPDGCMNGGGNFNLMRALRCFDIPGIDVIWRQLYPKNLLSVRDDMNGYNGFFPRYASSAAAQNGTGRSMTEVFGVAGPGLTYDIMRFTVGYQAVRGINIFNLFNFPLGRSGQLLAQELPVFTESQPYFRNLKLFNRYMERLSYISSLGERICDTALYYPISDFQGGLNGASVAASFEALGRTLEEMTVDFDIVDDDVIVASETEDGYIRMGNAAYRHIIIPPGAFVPRKTQLVLQEFIKNGGKASYDIHDAVPVLKVEGKGLRAMHRKTENAELYCLFRESGENAEYKIHLPAENGYLLCLENGELEHLKTEKAILNLSLAVGETAVVLLTGEGLEAQNKKEFISDSLVLDSFTFRKEAELICDEAGFGNVRHSGDSVPVKLGDWSALTGRAYSGSGIYETEFMLSDENVGASGKISLGDVHYAAEVYINGRFIGTVLTAPFSLEIPQGILKKSNILKVIVTNTTANWYVHTDYFSRWKTEELSPYFEAELKYAEDYVSGGLYGPVVIYT